MEGNKTELEKRWEEDEEIDDEEEESEEEGVDTSNFINHPLVNEGFMPMVLVTSGPRVIIGGLVEASDSVCVVKFPMAYIEMLVGNGPSDPNAQIKLMIRSVYLTLGIVDDMQFKHDSLYLLRNSSANDLKATRSYENALKEGLLSASGLVSPGEEDLARIRPIRT